MNKISKSGILVWCILLFISGFLGLNAYWKFGFVDVIEVTKVNLVTGAKYHPGDEVTVDFTFDKYLAEVPVTISKTMIKQDEPHLGMRVMVIASTGPATFPKGYNQEARMSFVIPTSTPPGRYKLLVNALYHVNPIRDFPEWWETPCFEVTK